MYCSISILFSESPSFIFFIISIIIVLFHIQQHNICSIWKLCLSFAGIRIWLSLHRNGKPYYFHLLRTCEEGGIYCYVEKTCKQYLLCQPWCWSATSNMWFWWWSRKCLVSSVSLFQVHCAQWFKRTHINDILRIQLWTHFCYSSLDWTIGMSVHKWLKGS